MMNKGSRQLISFVVVSVSMLPIAGWAQSAATRTPAEYKESASNTYYVSCGDSPPYKGRTAISPVLVSPNGENAAFAKVQVKADGTNACSNRSELFVRHGKTALFRRVLAIEPTQEELANGVKIVDWSPDGEFLLFETLGWQYASDAGFSEELAIFDVKQGKVLHPYLNNVFTIDPADCQTSIRALGFSDSSHYVINASSSPYFDPSEEAPRNKACPTSKQSWSVGLKDASLNRLAESPNIRKYGRVAPAATKSANAKPSR